MISLRYVGRTTIDVVSNASPPLCSQYCRNNFRPDEQEVLAKIFDLIPFETGDTIIQQGEKGSWAGMLLEGEFDAFVEGIGKVGSVPPGDFVGEMTVFEGGKRNATCKASKPGVIGAVLLSKLDDLYLDYPSLHVKLLQAFATSSLTKVRRMLESARTKGKKKEDGGKGKPNKKKKKKKRAGRMARPNSMGKQEVLYRMKIARFANAAKKVTKQLEKARQSEHAAKHSTNNEKLVRRKLQRQISHLQEEIAKYQEKEEEYQKMKALHAKGGGGGRDKKKRRRSEYRNASMGEIGVLAMQAAQATAENQVREAMARLARAEAAQKKLQARYEAERKAKLELASQLRKQSAAANDSGADADKAKGDVSRMQSVIDKLRAKQSATQSSWLTRHQSTQDMLDEARRENAQLKTSGERWRAAAVKASSREIERLKEELAEEKEAAEEKSEALEDAEANVDMLTDKLDQYKDVVELQRQSAATAKRASDMALERAERYKAKAEARTREYHAQMARLVRLLAFGVVKDHLNRSRLAREAARADAAEADAQAARDALESQRKALQDAADRRVRRCMASATLKMRAKAKRLAEERTQFVRDCRGAQTRARDLELELETARERAASAEAELHAQREAFGAASAHIQQQMDRQGRFLNNMKLDNEEREQAIQLQEASMRRTQTEHDSVMRSLAQCQRHLNLSEQRRVALERAVLVASGDKGDRRWWPGAAWLPPIDPASPPRAQRVARTLDARGNSVVLS